jgi:hypothetical protein
MPAKLDDTEEDGNARGHLDGVPPGSVEHLGGGHIVELEAASDIGQRTALDRRLPERLALARRQLLEDHVDEVSIGHGRLHIGTLAAIRAQPDQRLSQALPASQQVQAIVPRDRQQPAPGGRLFRGRVQRLERDHKNFLGGVGRIVGIAEDARAHPRDGGAVGLVEVVHQAIAARILHGSP